MKKATDLPYPDNQHTLLIQSVRFSDYTHQEMNQQDLPASVIDIQPPDRLYTVSHLVSRGFTGDGAHLHMGYYEFLLFLEGDARFTLNGQQYRLTPGDLLIIPPDMVHKAEINGTVTYGRIVLHISMPLLRLLSTRRTDFATLLLPRGGSLWHLNPQHLSELVRRVDRIPELEQSHEIAADALIRAYLTEILVYILQMIEGKSAQPVPSGSTDLMERIHNYINAHYTENISIQKIADDLSISRSLLSHEFKRNSGESLWKYVVNLRLASAQKLLLAGGNVTSACFDSGFQNYSNFIHLFTKTFGTTPRRYAESRREENNGTVYL